MPGGPLDSALDRVGDRWAFLVVSSLLGGPKRFNDLLDDLPGIAPNVLTQRLRALEKAGVLVATLYSRRPPRALYELTEAGHELAGALQLLARWGEGSGGADRCPTCGGPVGTDPDPVNGGGTGDGELRYL